MRFQRLQIPAFGPFTNLDLQFADKPCDLHVIYGANEAGKSSLLRAIRDLLFGIHSQSADNFRHDYGDLRIKGDIRNRAGDQLIFQRRKGNKNTLLGADGQQLPDNALMPFLGSVDQTYFSAMFGLGALELRDGAQQLLRGEGDIGQALFSASLGGTPIQKVVEALQQESERLFKGRSTVNVSIRPAAQHYKELIKQSREAMVNPETWEKTEKELAVAEKEKKRLEDEIDKNERELQWIARCEDALPTVGRLMDERQKLAQLPVLPELASDFSSRARAARQALSAAQVEVHRLNAQLGKFRSQLQECQTAPAVLAEADALDQLHQDLGAYRERKKTMADLQTKQAVLEPVIRAGMHSLQLSGEFSTLVSLRLSSPGRLACEESAAALKASWAEQVTNAEKTEEMINLISTQDVQLQSLPETDLTVLREALDFGAAATDADKTVSASAAEVRRLTRELADQHRQLTGAPEDLATTAPLPVPSMATIRRYREQIEESKREIKSEEGKVLEANKRAGVLQSELGRLQRRGELPTEEALQQARVQRDHGWSLVLAEWKGNGAREELIAGKPLEKAFPETISQADGIADKLRLQAEAVAQAEEKRFQISENEKQGGAAQERVVQLQGELAKREKSWQAEWSSCGITPRSPAEMEEWRDQWSQFRELFAKQTTAEESLQNKRHQIQQANQRLAAVLNQSEEKGFSVLFAAARKLVQDGEQSAGRRIELGNRLEGFKSALAKLEQARTRIFSTVNSAAEKWKLRCTTVGLAEGTSPEAGLTLLRERKELLGKFDEWQALSTKAQATVEEVEQYEKAVSAKAITLGSKGDTIEAFEAALWRALTEARKAQTRHDQIAEEIERTGRELEDAQVHASQSDQTLQNLLRLASLTSIDELEPLLAHLEQRNAVQAQIDNLSNTLSSLARGQAVDAFIAKVRAENAETLAERKSIAARDKQEKESVLPGIRETLFRLGNEKKTLEKAGDAAAAFRQQAESYAASLRQDAARFLRLRLATHLLQTQIERFRKENQGPLLQKSGDVFQSITRGAFSGLGAEFNADDVPILVGVRPDQTKVPVAGLSDGSRDQLFLALRIAALDRYLEEHEPMPLILDDLLITFDDERAKTILPQLGALAKRTQIFLFTHHEHLVELCRQNLDEGQFHLHRLDGIA